jgi:hypothetical protein
MRSEELLTLIAIANNATLADLLEACDEAKSQGPWTPACGGTEQVFQARSGKRLLYCWQQTTGKHAYLDVDSDLILSDEEARMHLQTY